MEVSSPGRICLFGEHQDYLGLPVIAMAMNLRLQINGRKRNDKKIIIHLPDIGKSVSFFINNSINTKPENIFRSGVKICVEEGLNFSKGFEVEIISKIPIQAGAGSSSALVVTWINFLSQIADNPMLWNREKIGQLAYKYFSFNQIIIYIILRNIMIKNFYGAQGRNRTTDTRIFSPLLYRLSYLGINI